jgi:hypothetical protein
LIEQVVAIWVILFEGKVQVTGLVVVVDIDGF